MKEIDTIKRQNLLLKRHLNKAEEDKNVKQNYQAFLDILAINHTTSWKEFEKRLDRLRRY